MDQTNEIEQKAMMPLPNGGRLLGLSRKTTYHWAAQGRFPVPVINVGRRLMVRRDQMEAYIDKITREAESRFADQQPANKQEADAVPHEPPAHRRPGRPRLGAGGA